MATETIKRVVSDLSGAEIPEGTEHAVISVKVNGKLYTGEATLDEVQEMIGKLRETTPRGRKPASK